MSSNQGVDLDALEALTQYKPPRWETIPLQVPIDTAVLRTLVQRVREAEADALGLAKTEDKLLKRIAKLERVRVAATKIIDPAENLLTRKQRDWSALFALEQALAAVDDDR